MEITKTISNKTTASIARIPSISRGHHIANWTSPAPSDPSLDPEQQNFKSAVANNESQPRAEQWTRAEIERLGRERPPAFKSIWTESAFVFSIVISQILSEYFVSGFNLFLATLVKELHISPASSIWASSSFSLVVASTLLPFGRLGDILGGYPVYMGGMAWLLVWSVVAGFSVNPIMLIVARALQGLGAAAFLPTGVMLLGSVYRPGPRKNVIFAIYGTSAVVGFYVGIFVAGLVGQYTRWGLYFWIGAAVAAIALLTSMYSIPGDKRTVFNKEISMDWLGIGTIVPGVILIIFAITESANEPDGWRTPWIPVIFIVGCVLLLAAIYVEGWVAKLPLLPPDLFKVPGMTALILAMMLSAGNIGICLLYGTLYFQNIMGATPLQCVAWFAPTFVGGILLSTAEGFVLHLVSSRVLLVISCLGSFGCQLLLALVPLGANYWAWIFPAMILATIGIDLSINLMMIFITTQLPVARQGLGGGIVNSVIQLGIAFSLGWCDVIQVYTEEKAGLRQSYQNTFWFGFAAGIVSLIILLIWVDIPKATSDYTADEKEQMREQPVHELLPRKEGNETVS